MAYAIGSDGSVTLPSGYNAQLNTWSATISRTTSIVTGFGDTGHQRRASGVVDLTGSAGGVPEYNAATTIPFPTAAGPPIVLNDAAGGSMTLQVADGCTLAFGAVFSSYAFSVTNDGDSTITFNFEMNDSDGPTVAWDETA
jgi:hypothetical protein